MMTSTMKKIRVVDSHTGGEPTRVVIEGGPELGSGSVADRLNVFREKYDEIRRALVNEPRGSEVLVGAMLLKPQDESCVAGVIFFDNVQFIGMCGHGTIGLVATLEYLGTIAHGQHKIETPVGVVSVELNANGWVTLTNVPSYRKTKSAEIDVPGFGTVIGDVAWGGNWFYFVESHPIELSMANIDRLTEFAWSIRLAVNTQGFPEVDHIVLLGNPSSRKAHSKNFVLCPGKAYDRSPCGTGTSARLACLAADGRLGAGETMVQESIIGSMFTGQYRWLDRDAGTVVPMITGKAFITSDATLLLDERDPYCFGIR